jgi:hypothetical protein
VGVRVKEVSAGAADNVALERRTVRLGADAKMAFTEQTQPPGAVVQESEAGHSRTPGWWSLWRRHSSLSDAFAATRGHMKANFSLGPQQNGGDGQCQAPARRAMPARSAWKRKPLTPSSS